MNKILFLFLFVTLLISCTKDPESTSVEVEGLKPIYSSTFDETLIKSEDPKAFDQLGKIVYAGSLLFINEQNQGIHVLDIENPLDPQTLAFLNIPFNFDFTLKDNLLYADSGIDLLVIDITDIRNIKFLNKISQLYSTTANNLSPQEYEGFFECVDETKGEIWGWEETLLIDPKCFK